MWRHAQPVAACLWAAAAVAYLPQWTTNQASPAAAPQVMADDGSWRLVGPVAGALTVNVGDMFQVGS